MAAPPPTRATFLRFPPAVGFGGQMLQAPPEGQQPAWSERRRRQHTERSGAPAAEPGKLLRSSRLGLGVTLPLWLAADLQDWVREVGGWEDTGVWAAQVFGFCSL